MDSGLGKEAFSIIQSGEVEEILNSKPEERRTIFEEAAGVLKLQNQEEKKPRISCLKPKKTQSCQRYPPRT